MLASLADPPVSQPGLVYEPKYDGIRALVDIQPAGRKAHGTKGSPAPRIALYSRNGNNKSAQFPEIVRTLTAIAGRLPGPVLLDAEIVATDAEATPLGFQHIQGRIHLTGTAEIERAARQQPAALVVFDILRDGDDDLRSRPLVERRIVLQKRVKPTSSERRVVRLSEIAVDDGQPLLDRANQEGWEGLIVKEGHSVYQSGRRTPAWRKLKLLKQQEFVIGGWTEPRLSRHHFGALLVGYYDVNGELRWAGSVGTGFDQAELDRVAALLRRIEISKSPFADGFKTMERPHWVKPELVAEVKFTEWTSDGLLRQPVYLGLRADKKAKDVRREDNRTPPKPVLPGGAIYQKNRRIPTGTPGTPGTPGTGARGPRGSTGSARPEAVEGRGWGPAEQKEAPAARARIVSLRTPERERAGVGPREHQRKE